ncbi:hypothetical protein [Algivirga pacifica]|uniref:TerB family tellurite resistance protein n=1 Tax=Algivirga pacifica TaxID=1162670 RepID=A0ABP9DKF5_9BACT
MNTIVKTYQLTETDQEFLNKYDYALKRSLLSVLLEEESSYQAKEEILGVINTIGTDTINMAQLDQIIGMPQDSDWKTISGYLSEPFKASVLKKIIGAAIATGHIDPDSLERIYQVGHDLDMSDEYAHYLVDRSLHTAS